MGAYPGCTDLNDPEQELKRGQFTLFIIFFKSKIMMLNSKMTISSIEYKICGIIGEGGAAIVYLAKDSRNNSYALKMIKNYHDPFIKKMVDAELRIQKQFKDNKYVIQYVGYEASDKFVYIVLQLGQCSLRNWIDASREISQAEFINLICDVCEGLRSIHNKKMIHRDIKPENIIKKDNIYKITDFGVSCQNQEDQSMSGTPVYWAPQILFQEKNTFTNKVDVWSLGVTLFQVYFKVNPFCPDKNLSFKKAIQQIKANIRALTPRFSIEKFIKFLKQKGKVDEYLFVQRKLKNTDKNLIENLCLFFQQKPEARPDIDLLFVLFQSLRGQIQMPAIRKTTRNSTFSSWEAVPQDIRMFCRGKDLFYELSAFYKTKLYDKVLFGLQLGIWYLQGANYGGIHYILLDKINFLKQYRKPVKQLWMQIKTLLSQYYFYLKCDEEVKNFDKLDELRLHILVCSIWNDIMKQTQQFCHIIGKITKFEIQHPLRIFEFLQLFSDRHVSQIEETLISKFYV